MEYKPSEPFEPPAREPDPGTVLEKKSLRRDYPKRYCTEMHNRMLGLVTTGAVLGAFSWYGEYPYLLMLSAAVVVAGLLCGIREMGASKCPHCHEAISLRGPADNCPKCGEWIPYDEYSRKPEDKRTYRRNSTGNDPLVHGGK